MAAAPASATSLRPAWVSSLRGLDRRLLLVGYLYFIIFFVSNGVLMSTVSLYLGQRWGDRISLGSVVVGVSSLAGAILALRALLGIVAGPVAGVISDRLVSRWPVTGGGILLGVTGFLLLTMPAGIWVVPLGVSLVAMSAGAMIAVLAAQVGDTVGGSGRGVSMGLMATAGDAGSALGPLLAYGLAASFDLRWVYFVCALILASGLVATLGLRHEKGRAALGP
jgi:MFS family permease